MADTITASEDSAGAVVALVQNDDGSVACTAVAPGAAQVTWTDGTISFSDTINVTAGDAATICEPATTRPDPPCSGGGSGRSSAPAVKYRSTGRSSSVPAFSLP